MADRLMAAPVVDGHVNWGQARTVADTPEAARQRGRLRARKAARALEVAMHHPVISHRAVERVRAYLADERKVI